MRNSKGVSEVVGNLMILIIIAISLSAILSYSYPLILSSQENIKMRNVVSAIVFAKEKMDLVSSDVVPSTTVKFPPSGGYIGVSHNFYIYIYINSSLIDVTNNPGELVYNSGNKYLAVEMGGVFKKEGINDWIIYPPELIKSGNNIAINIIDLSGEGSAGGYGIVNVYMRYIYQKTYYYPNSELKIVMKTNYPSAWERYLKKQGFKVSVSGNEVTAETEGNVTVCVYGIKILI